MSLGSRGQKGNGSWNPDPQPFLYRKSVKNRQFRSFYLLFFCAAVQQAALPGGDRGRGEGGHCLRQHGRQAGQSARHQQHVSRTQEVGTTRAYKMFFCAPSKNTGQFSEILRYHSLIIFIPGSILFIVRNPNLRPGYGFKIFLKTFNVFSKNNQFTPNAQCYALCF
jgi:hypothetical protein